VAAPPDFTIEPHVASGGLAPVLTDYAPPDAGVFVVRPPGDSPPRKVRVLTDIFLEYSGGGQWLDGIKEVAVDDRLMLSGVHVTAVDDLAEVEADASQSDIEIFIAVIRRRDPGGSFLRQVPE